ncbi:MAG: hypothetical protein Q8N05_11295 [Bacteroidota bacterium]|nr:hypothetical protein [Bacteroidota bacterium]
MNFKKIISLIIIFGISGYSCFSQTETGVNKIRMYNYPMNPRQHPDDARRLVKPPDAGTFGNQIQFMALRSLEGDYKKSLDNYTVKYGLGNIIWPKYPLIYRKDLPEIVSELKKRGLYLFDIWGYVPGSSCRDCSGQEFSVPQNALNLFEKELGPRWLGMDNGEQDGRYIGLYASQMISPGGSREQQYLNFQNHFQGLTDRLGNKMTILISLNFGHYLLKEGVSTMIGAETAQALPNGQIYYSFIRGAGKQYGVPWFGNASVFNRWGWKNYSGITSDNGGDMEGTSLSLLKRLIYSHIMYNCVAVGFEGSFFNKNDPGWYQVPAQYEKEIRYKSKEELSPIGKIQQSANKWVKKYGNPGNLYTPVAVMVDFFSGWTFPRQQYTNNVYRVWGNLPYEEGDYLTDGILNMLYPGYQDASYFHDETGFIAPTPHGDIADCILSDCPLWLLKQYPVLVIADKLKGGYEIKDKLEKYVESGGHLIITAGSLENMPDGLSGINTGKDDITFNNNASVSYNKTKLKEESAFQIKDIHFPGETNTIATCNNKPLVIEHAVGLGKITAFASSFGLGSNPRGIPKSAIDSTFKTPFPLLNHVKLILGDIFSRNEIFNSGEDLSLITCRKSKGEFTVAVCNNSWLEKPLQITSNAGKIIKITELPLDCSEQKAIGFLPRNFVNNTGKNTGKTIKGGDIRIFNIKMEENNIEDVPFIQPAPNPVNRGLTLRNISSIKDEILLRPTFFQNFDRIIIDWKYLLEKEKSILANESGWINRQGLKVIVDFSSGINLYPDLRLVNSDSLEYARSMEAIKSVIDKMTVLGASDLILTTHRKVEINFTMEKFNESLQNTIKVICQYAAKHKINVNLRMASGRNPGNLEQISALIKSVNEPNLYVAPVTALILGNPDEFNKNLALLKNLKFRILLVGAPEKDNYGTLWNYNKPINDFPDKQVLKQLLLSNPESTLVLDGLFKGSDEEYKDIKTIENLQKN